MSQLFEVECGNGHKVQYVRTRSGTCFHAKTPGKLRKLLERLRKDRTIVRVFYGDTQTGQSWHDEFDVVGFVGRSTGMVKVPLLVPPSDSGGPEILDHCILRIDTQTETLYQHRKFRVGEMILQTGNDKELPWEVLIDGDLYARCAENTEAVKLMSFLQGSLFALN